MVVATTVAATMVVAAIMIVVRPLTFVTRLGSGFKRRGRRLLLGGVRLIATRPATLLDVDFGAAPHGWTPPPRRVRRCPTILCVLMGRRGKGKG